MHVSATVWENARICYSVGKWNAVSICQICPLLLKYPVTYFMIMDFEPCLKISTFKGGSGLDYNNLRWIGIRKF